MVIKAFKSLFGGNQSPAQAAPAYPAGPFGLGVGLAARVDLMRLTLVRDALAMPPMPETLIVALHGITDLGDGSTLHRLYDRDGNFLQVVCHGGPEEVGEVMCFRPWDSLVPQSDRQWADWDGRDGAIGDASFSSDGFSFERSWGDPSDGWVSPVEFTEIVTSPTGVRRIHEKVMSYRRPVEGTEWMETLLIAARRDIDGGDRGSVEFSIGYDVFPVEVSTV